MLLHAVKCGITSVGFGPVKIGTLIHYHIDTVVTTKVSKHLQPKVSVVPPPYRTVACRFASPKPEESTGYSRQCWPHSQGRAHTTSGRINRGGEPPDGLALYPVKYECTLSLGFGLLDSTSRQVRGHPSTSLWGRIPHKPQGAHVATQAWVFC